MQARTPGIMRFSLPHDRDGRPCLPTRSRPTSPPSPPRERPVAAATRWPASWAWRPPRSWPGRGSFGLENGPAQPARWFATVTRPLRCDLTLACPSGRGPSQIGSIEEVSASREVTWEGFFNARDLGGLPTRDARMSDCGALIRSADPRFVTEAEWRTAHDAGVRTVIDLRCGESRGRRSSSSFTP
jgi:hypothetical protein